MNTISLKTFCSCFARYGIHLWDVYHDGVWENRAIYVYYSELMFEISALAVDFCHHLHMLVNTTVIHLRAEGDTRNE
jgi:hypothetical protein